MPLMKAKPEWLKAMTAISRSAVDRKQRAILGYVVAQTGDFKDGRGAFNESGLRQIVALMQREPKGLKSRLGHPTASDDGISKMVGRARNPRLDSARTPAGQTVPAVRADLFLVDSAFEKNPNGNLGEYILSRAEEDPDSFSSSLVLQVKEEERLDADGRLMLDEHGDPLPPYWNPTALHASDIVDTGAACDSFLSAGLEIEGLPNEIVWRAAQLLDSQFANQPKDVIRARCLAWLDRYLDGKEDVPAPLTPALDSRRLKLDQMAMKVRELGAG